MKMRYTAILIGAALPCVTIAPALAASGGDLFSGEFLVGYRSVDVNGSEPKYMQHYNLDDGARLLNLDLDMKPGEGGFADLVHFDLNNYGGDPFQTLDVTVKKYGKYDLSYSRRESTYFYEDVILPQDLADVRLSSGGDFHHFDFDRVQDTASLSLNLSQASKIYFNFDRITKKGDSTTTLDIQRDEFELDKPVDETKKDYTLGVEHAWSKVTAVYEYQRRDYENMYQIFLPGASEGENTGNAAMLDFYFLDQPYDYSSDAHTVRVNARPNNRLIMRGAATWRNLDANIHASESSGGIGFNGQPFTTDPIGNGDLNQDLNLYDFDVTYLINDRLAFVGGARSYSLDQDGTFPFDGAINTGAWKIDTTGFDAGLEFNLTPTVVIAGGARQESRTIKHGDNEDGSPVDLHEEKTDHTGVFASASWRPRSGTFVEAEVESSDYDDPFTLNAPTDRTRFRLKGRSRFANGAYVSGTYLYHKYKNSDVDWKADQTEIQARAGYSREGLDASLGYTSIDTGRKVDQVIVAGSSTYLYPIDFQANADFVDARVLWTLSEQWRFGGEFRDYKNDGSFAVNQQDGRLFAETRVLEDFLVNLSVRSIYYEEPDTGYNNYDANIVELSVGYRWGNGKK